MKTLKKALVLLLAAVMMLVLAVPAFADEEPETTPSGTITINGVTKGQDYSVYKIFDASQNETTGKSAYYLTELNGAVAEAIQNDDDAPFSISDIADASGRYAVTVTDDNADIIKWITENLFNVDEDAKTVTPVTGLRAVVSTPEGGATSNTLTFNVDYGYYFITSTMGTVITVNQVTPSVTVNDKNVPEADPISNPFKVIDIVGEDDDENVTVETVDIGADVNFRIGFTANNIYQKTLNKGTENEETVYYTVTDYTVLDKPENLDVDLSTLEVYVGRTLLTTDTDYTVEEITADNLSTLKEKYSRMAADMVPGGFIVNIDWVDTDGNSLYSAPVEVAISYEAEVLATPAKNNADIMLLSVDEDGNEPTDKPDIEQPDGDTLYSYTIQVKKVDGTDENTLLDGAKFVLKDEEGKYYNLANGEVEWVSVNEGETLAGLISAGKVTQVTTVSGLASFAGLEAGTYYLVETEAPAGYNLLEDPVEVELADVGEDGWNVNSMLVVQPVENNTGSVLPTTGGMGTTILYILGGILVIGAGILLVVRRRMSVAD